MKINFVLLVWGQAYTDLFRTVSLPTLLSPGNLPAMGDALRSASFKLYTRPGEAEAIERSPVWARLRGLVDTEAVFVRDADLDAAPKYTVMKQVHRHATAQANAEDRALVFLAPDAVWADGTFASVKRIAETGKRAIMVPSYRMASETFVPAIARERGLNAGDPLTFAPRELVRLSLEHLHPISRAFFWDSDDFHRSPSHLYWPVGDLGREGLLMRCFHIHPLLIWPRNKQVEPVATIDGKYVASACPDFDDLHVATDSDEMFVPELSTMHDQRLMMPVLSGGNNLLRYLHLKSNLHNDWSLKAVAVAHWAQRTADAYHREFLKLKVRCHAGDLSPQWAHVERQSDAAVAQVAHWMGQDLDRLMAESFCPQLVEALRQPLAA